MTALRTGFFDALADPVTLRLSTGAPTDKLAVPQSVRVADGVIHFSEPSGRQVVPPADLLQRFLAATTQDRIQKFASRFGPLLLSGADGLGPSIYILPHDERVEDWLRHRQLLNDVLALAAGLRLGDGFDVEPWGEHLSAMGLNKVGLMGDLWSKRMLGTKWSGRTRAQRRALVGIGVEIAAARLAEEFRLRPALRRKGDGDSFEFIIAGGIGSFSVGSAVAVQLLIAVAGSQLFTCANCGRAFVPRRRPAVDRRAFCETVGCGKAAALRFAKADQRKRERSLSQSERVGNKRGRA